MRLLVSVRSAAEVAAALAGGADIIDAKEPARGALGAVDPAVLGRIAAEVPGAVPLSIALGDLRTVREVEGAIAGAGVRRREGGVYLKIGFAGVRSEIRIAELIAAAVALTRARPGRPAVVAVAYADDARADALSPATIAGIAAAVGAAGVLLDTYRKDEGDLFSWTSPAALRRWTADARGHGLLAATAGSLGLESVAAAMAAGPDIIGVRGAACEGGREGVVDAERVRALRAIIASETVI
ncbi:MAG: (5-formylfuran-3-yl)methyl phosphate synthase, partial [Gemmatimonadales bacterium]